MAQWMAQATEVTTPKASQFILIFMDCKCMHNSNNVAFFYFLAHTSSLCSAQNQGVIRLLLFFFQILPNQRQSNKFLSFYIYY